MFRIGKSIDRESRTVVWGNSGGTGAVGREEWGRSANGWRVSFWGDENVLKLNSGVGCTTP